MSINDAFSDYQFYPTPSEVLLQMDIHPEGKNVADLSAGKGNILDYCKLNGAKTLLAAEKEPNLTLILKGKGYNVISDDCFKVTSKDVSHVDLFVLNPPFKDAKKHTGKPTGNELHYLIQKFGFSRQLGNVFNYSERKTKVDVSLIHLFKPIKTLDNLDFEKIYFSNKENYENINQGLIKHNSVVEIVNRVKGSMELYREMKVLASRIESLAKPFGVTSDNFGFNLNDRKSGDFDYFQKRIHKDAWEMVFSEMNIDKYLTTNVLEKLNKFMEERKHFPFTLENVYKTIEYIIANVPSMIKNSIVKAIDYFKELAYNESTELGWKTNKNNILNTKFIVDNIAYRDDNTVMVSECSGSTQRIEDLMKVIYIDKGLSYNKENHSLTSTVSKIKPSSGEGFIWNDIFYVKMYYKRTAHFHFIHERDWREINIMYANAVGLAIPEEKTDVVWRQRNYKHNRNQ